ncbi:MAG: peptide MFS transporter [Wenzhouxiangellaceae bacterium]
MNKQLQQNPAASNDWFGHPKGVYICFATEMWERFSFYGMKALLFLYLTKYHLFGDTPSYELLGAYGGLVYAMPLIGGMLADRYLGMRRAVILGGILLVLGHAGMAYEGHAAYLANGEVVRDTGALQVFYLSLALIITGVGFLKPNISTIVGKLYPANDPRRDSGFTLFYAGINLGALAASLIAAFLGEVYGWKWGFGAAGVGMLIGLIVFISGQKHLHGLAEPNHPERLRERAFGPLNREWSIYLGSLLMVAAVWQVIQWHSIYLELPLSALGLSQDFSQSAVLMIMNAVFLIFLLWFGWFLVKRCTPQQRHQMLVLMALILAALIFFTLYEQTYGSWVAFTDRLMTKDLFGFALEGEQGIPWMIFPLALSPPLLALALNARSATVVRISSIGIIAVMLGFVVALFHDIVLMPQTAGSLTFLGAFFIVVLSPVFSWLWPWLAKRGLNPSKPAKSAIGLLLAGVAFVPMLLAAQTAGDGVMASVWWLVLAYLVLEMGELSLSPVGLSAVTQLSVASVVSVMMGAWFLATAYSEVLAAELGKLAAIDDLASDGALNMTAAAAKYQELFMLMVWLGLGAGVLYLLLTPLLKRGMHGVE